jgi:hypothetical protein
VASNTCSGENSSDCGSEISGQPAKALGDHHGQSPRASDAARNCIGGKNCDFASHGIVTAPDSHGHAHATNASAKIATVTSSEARMDATRVSACPQATLARHALPSGEIAGSFLGLIPGSPSGPIPKFASFVRHPRLRTSESRTTSNSMILVPL